MPCKMGNTEACWEGTSPYRKESKEAIRDATPQTVTVALVRLEPVPPPDAPPDMSTRAGVRNESATELS